MTTATFQFIKTDWTISLADMPKYTEFRGEFIEPLDSHILQLFMETTNPNITSIMKQEIQDKLIKNINHTTGNLSVYHHQTHGLGRFYPNDNISLIPHSKYIKHSIFKYLGWKDIDMVKGHMTIALEMGKSVGLAFNAIQRYVDSFPEICEEVREFYQLDDGDNALADDDVKWLFCVMMYGGGLKCWVDGLGEGDEKCGYKPRQVKNSDKYAPFAQSFKTETKTIIDRIYTKNPGLVRKLKKPDDELFKTKGSVASYWFQTIENHIIHIVYTHLVEQKLIKPKVCGLEYDGLCLPPLLKNVDEDQLIDDINTIIRLKTGLNVKMKFKDYSPAFVLEEIVEQRHHFIPPVIAVAVEEFVNENPNSSREYIEWKRSFELECCKIKNNAIFIRRYIENGEVKLITHNKASLITAYEHESYYKTDDKGKSKKMVYIHEWLSDASMLCYDSIQCVPPPLVCPDNVYNLWIPSPFENQPMDPDTDPEYNIDAVKAFANHVEILANHNQETYEYIMNWVSQSIQRPAEKMGVALNFIGDQGIGKGTFTEILTELYGGVHKRLETTDPERDVWGQFNNMMIDAYFIVLNETDQRNAIGHDGKIKALITDPTINISQKGKGTFPMNSYHRIIQNTNTEDPAKTSKTDRRNVIIRCSDEKLGDKAYFSQLNELLHSPNALRSIYWTLKNQDISTFKRGDKIVTEYHEQIIECNENPLHLFMCWFVGNNSGLVEISSIDFLKSFTDWRHQTNFKFGENMNVLSLIKKITLTLKPPKDAFYVVKGRTSNMRCIDTDKMMGFLGMETEVGEEPASPASPA